MPTIATIGYQTATVHSFLEALERAGIDLLVDVRAVASSRRPGFAKSQLAANVATIGVEYLHLRGLGTPAEGRAAARAGRHAELKAIYAEQLKTAAARADLDVLADLVRGKRHVCLVCLEADPTYCHRSLVVAALSDMMPLRARHLHPAAEEE